MAFKMKNTSLAKAMKEATPIQLNYGSPAKKDKGDFARKEEQRLKKEKTINKVKDFAIEGAKRALDPFGIVEKGYNYLKGTEEEKKKNIKRDQERKKFERKRKNDPQYKYRKGIEGPKKSKGKYGAQG
tara:strand:- start:276 stop:659 length:384 start_codon:yes stop_codon:yes gene_type:complete